MDKCAICGKNVKENENGGYIDAENKEDLVHMTCWLMAQFLVEKYPQRDNVHIIQNFGGQNETDIQHE